MPASSTARRSSTTCSIHPPRTNCRKTIRRRITRGCSITPRRPASASSASACWPAARLSGSAERHPIASPAPEPIGSAMSYDADIERARRLMPLVEEGFASSLTEAATRFALSHPAMGTILVGMATPQEFEGALRRGRKRPAAAGGARSAGDVAAGVFRRAAVIGRGPQDRDGCQRHLCRIPA